MPELNSICVFCGSSDGNDTSISEAARILGETMAGQNIELVYGAAHIGIMGAVAEATLQAGGNVVGVIPEFLKKKEVVHLGLTKLITTPNMHERKLKMHDLSDGFIALPGNFFNDTATTEIYTWLQLGLHQKPIGLLNVNHFYDDLLQLLETMVRKGFVSMSNYELLLVDSTIDGLLEKMRSFKAPDIPHWLTKERT